MNSIRLRKTFNKTIKRMLACTAGGLLACAGLMACTMATAQQPGMQQPGAQNPTQQPTSPNPNVGNPTTPGMNMPGMENNANTPSPGDQSFLHKTLEDSAAEMQMGQLAQQKSASEDVKEYGQKMAQIHEQLNNQLKPVAKKLGVDEPKGPSKKDKQEIAQMQALSGPDFDTAFIKAMLKEQQNDVKDFKDAAQGAQDPNVQQLAKMDAPVLTQHLQILEQLAQAHNVTLDSKK
jgi:putative membrane protein